MHIDAYVLAVPEKNKQAYIQAATLFAAVAKDHGVIEVVENWEVKVPDGKITDFRQAVKAEPGEKIVFSWIIWPDEASAIASREAMMADPRMAEMGDMPFDGKRMIMGEFEPILTIGRASG